MRISRCVRTAPMRRRPRNNADIIACQPFCGGKGAGDGPFLLKGGEDAGVARRVYSSPARMNFTR